MYLLGGASHGFVVFFHGAFPFLLCILFSFSIYFFVKDMKTRKDNFTTNQFFIPLTLYFSYCFIATVINGNAFAFFNNGAYVVHSAFFIYLCMIKEESQEIEERSFYQLLWLIAGTVFFFVITSLLTYIVRRLPLYQGLSNPMKDFLNLSAGVGRRLYGTVGNANTLAYLILYGFFLLLTLIYLTKDKGWKNFLYFFVIVSVVCLVLTGARGALLITLFCICLLFLSLFLKYKNHREHTKKLVLSVSILLVLCIVIGLFYAFSDSSFALKGRTYFVERILRLDNLKSGDERLENWHIAIGLLNIKTIWFGLSDSTLYHHYLSIGSDLAKYFINNEGRLHNYFMINLVSWGLPSLLLFLFLLGKTAFVWLQVKHSFSGQKEVVMTLVMIQFVAMVMSAFFEQLMLGTCTAISLPTCFVWGYLMSEMEKVNTLEKKRNII